MEIAGKYQSNNGEMEISQIGKKITGKYAKEGIIEGELSDMILNGIWRNNGAEGLLKLIFNEDASFTGNYKKGLEEGPMRSKWTGLKLNKEVAALNENSNPVIQKNISKQILNYEGDIDDGKKHGIGKYIDKDGDIFEGKWENNMFINGTATLTDGTFEEGFFLDFQLHGYGKATSKDEDGDEGDLIIEEGEFDNGYLIKGKITYADGSLEEGEFNEEGLNGIGKSKIKDEENEWHLEEGKFENGILIEGKIIYADGLVENGEFNEEGELNGKGMRIWPEDGGFQDGIWQNDEFIEGTVKLVYDNGSSYEGNMKDDEYHGYGKLIKQDGSIAEGIWNMGQLPNKLNKTAENKKNEDDENVSIEKVNESDVTQGDGVVEFIKNSEPSHLANLYQKKDYIGVCINADLSRDYSNNIFDKILLSAIETNNSDVFQFCKDKVDKFSWGWGMKKGNGEFQKNWETYFKNNTRLLKPETEYSGDLNSENKPHGHGKLLYLKTNGVYEGMFQNGERHGKGLHNWGNGDRYEGDWQNNGRTGFGKMIYANGDIYDGEWLKNDRNGKGKMIFINGDFKDGAWENNRFISGIAKLTSATKYYSHDNDTGDWRFEGLIENGKKNGLGKLFKNNKLVFDGNFINDEFGEGQNNLEVKMGDGTKITGDTQNGKGRKDYPNLDFMEGVWKDGNLLEGKVKLTNSHGYRYEGEYKNGDRHGIGKLINPDGTLDYEGSFILGEKGDKVKQRIKLMEDFISRANLKKSPSTGILGFFTKDKSGAVSKKEYEKQIFELFQSKKYIECIEKFVYYFFEFNPNPSNETAVFVAFLKSLYFEPNFQVEFENHITKFYVKGCSELDELLGDFYLLRIEKTTNKFRIARPENKKPYFASETFTTVDIPINSDYSEIFQIYKGNLEHYKKLDVSNIEKTKRANYLLEMISETQRQWNSWAEYRNRKKEEKQPEEKAKKIEKKESKPEPSKNKSNHRFEINYRIKLKEEASMFNTKNFSDIFNNDKGDFRKRTINVVHNDISMSDSKAKSYVIENDKDVIKGIAGSSTIVVDSIKKLY